MTRARGLTKSLATPRSGVRKLQRALYAKAKAEPNFRFYSLWDKVWRKDVIAEAYRRCRANRGGPGVDGESFSQIETEGVDGWLGKLREELRDGRYRSQPLKRVWIPKANGGQRALGVPTVHDRVAQMAVNLVMQPIFEADFPRNQYGFRPRLDAKMAVRKVHHHMAQHGRTEIVDADLKDYFTTIPHGALMKSVARRVADGRILSLIKMWLETAVEEHTDEGIERTTQAKDGHRGTPQGGVISPLLANIYFRRFLKAWDRSWLGRHGKACVVNYADDLVICCYPGHALQACQAMEGLVGRLGLEVNQDKTRIARAPGDAFEFLGYSFERCFGRNGKAYLGTRPSKKAVQRLRRAVHAETAINTTWDTAENRTKRLNAILRGWSGYFNQGPVLPTYRQIARYTEGRLRRWLVKKHKHRTSKGYRRYPSAYLYETLGLMQLPKRRADLSSAKA